VSNEMFIGGPWDGERVEVQDGLSDVWAPIPQRTTYPAISPPVDIQLTKARYKRMLFAGEKQTHSVFVESSLTPDDVLRMLLFRYGKKAYYPRLAR